jgi:hypothetical protein
MENGTGGPVRSNRLKDAMMWAENKGDKKRKPSVWKEKIVYIIICIVFFIIFIYILYLSYRNADDIPMPILDNIIEPEGRISTDRISTPYRPGPRSPIAYLTPPASYRPSVRVQSSYRQPQPSYVPSPGGTSVISPNARMYPTVQNGVSGLMVVPRSHRY